MKIEINKFNNAEISKSLNLFQRNFGNVMPSKMVINREVLLEYTKKQPAVLQNEKPIDFVTMVETGDKELRFFGINVEISTELPKNFIILEK